MIGRLPPAGQRVLPDAALEPPRFPGMRALWLSSGTAALALAIRGALEARAGAKEVVLPAYGCPDLVAAAVYVGATPVLVDCHGADPGFDLELLDAACGANTAAVVAVNFLGIHERLDEIRGIASRSGAVLIEDCAQWYPEHPAPVPVAARVISFGRGKPVNLLGGGALLVDERGPLSGCVLPPDGRMSELGMGKAKVFNLLLQPVAYGLVSSIPGLELGATRYHPLEGIAGMDSVRLSRVGANIAAHLDRSRWREERVAALLGGCDRVRLLPRELGARSGRLLRYPLLLDHGLLRDELLRELRRYGASAMYAAALPSVEGVDGFFPRSTRLPGADAFASRLLTLPLHEGVNERHLRAMTEVIRRVTAKS